MWQYVVLAIVILSAIGYVVYRTWQSFRAASDPCHGCSGCAIHDQLKKKQKLEGRKKPACFKQFHLRNLSIGLLELIFLLDVCERFLVSYMNKILRNLY